MIPTILESSLFIHFAISDFPQWNRRLRWWIAIFTSGSKVWETTWLPSSLPNLWTGRRFKRWGAVGFRFWNYRWGFRFCWGHIEWGHGTREDTWFSNSTISNIKSKMKMKIVEFQKTTKTHQIRTSRWKSCPESSSRLYQQPRRRGLEEHQPGFREVNNGTSSMSFMRNYIWVRNIDHHASVFSRGNFH